MRVNPEMLNDEILKVYAYGNLAIQKWNAQHL